MTSYLVTIETDHRWTWLKRRARDEQTATETSGAEEKTQKNLRGGGGIPPPLYVRGLWVEY